MNDRHLIASDIDAYLAQHQQKDLLRLFTAGSVDDGKSTLIGRLLYDSKLVYEDQLAALHRDSEKKSSAGGAIDYSLLLDGLLAEREQGITIDVAYRYFSTPRRKFIIADTPGHEQYTRNMATGASTADLAIILIDARQGVLPQTRRHTYIAWLLGIKHIVVAVNKMDLVDYSASVFDSIRRDYLAFADRLGAADIHFMPISALLGDNVVEPSRNTPFFEGAPLLTYLETVSIDRDRNSADLRFPVQYVLRPNLDFRGFGGTLASGVVRRGDRVMALPSRRTSTVKSIVTYDGELEEAYPPMAVTLTLEDEIDISRGDILVREDDLPHVGRSIEATVVWMNEQPMRPRGTYWLKHGTHMVSAEIDDLAFLVDVTTLDQKPAETMRLNDIGRVRLTTSRPLFFDAYRKNRATGAFILIDRITNATVGAGMIEGPAEVEDTRPRAGRVTREERAARQGHRAATVWIRATELDRGEALAAAVERRLFDEGYLAHAPERALLDDASASLVARLGEAMGAITIIAASHDDSSRMADARAALGPERFIEVTCAEGGEAEVEAIVQALRARSVIR